MNKILVITGPTSSGKTSYSLELAKSFSGEIISADSMQIYRGMDIGTAKATEEERKLAPHHLIDIISPNDSFSVEQYRALALEKINEITARGNLPIIVGGTGLYIDSLFRGPMNVSPESDPEYREALLASVKTDADKHALWERLREIDPVSAEKIHENNVRRVARALEIYEKSGKPKSYFDELSQKERPQLSPLVIAFDFYDRENLYKRINKRVDKMIEDGLLSELQTLLDLGQLDKNSLAAQAIGYKELIAYIDGQCSFSEAVEEIKLSTRRYAKRQLTWFRHMERKTVYLDDESGSLRPSDEVKKELFTLAANFFEGEYSE